MSDPDDVYFRVLIHPEVGISVRHVQWFDESDYDPNLWAKGADGEALRFDTEAEARKHADLCGLQRKSMEWPPTSTIDLLGQMQQRVVEDRAAKVTLPEFYAGYLIVLSENGIVYTTQTGGTCCAHPEARGHLVPFGSFGHVDDLEEASKSSGVYDSWPLAADDPVFGVFLMHLYQEERSSQMPEVQVASAESVARVAHLLSNYNTAPAFGEAWVPVMYKGRVAILTWPNSD